MKAPESLSITENLLTVNEWSRPGRKLHELRAVVMHWTANPGADETENRDFFEARKDGKNGYGSAHYIIGQKGGILRCIPDDEVAYHCGSSVPDPASGRVYTDEARRRFGRYALDWETLSPNLVTIGIEMCPEDTDGNFSWNTRISAAALCARLLSAHGLDVDRLTTHHDIVGWKDCPRLWTRSPWLFEGFKDTVYDFMHGKEIKWQVMKNTAS